MDAQLESIIKEAFWETFHASGELWFNYLGSAEECEESTQQKWEEFIEILRSIHHSHNRPATPA